MALLYSDGNHDQDRRVRDIIESFPPTACFLYNFACYMGW